MDISCPQQSCKSKLQNEDSTLCGFTTPQILLSRRKFTELHINLKLALITDAELNQISQRSLADKYNVSKTAVQRILQQKDEIRKFADAPQQTLKRKRQMVYSDIDLHVQKWYECCKRKKIPISGPRLQNKALEIAKSLQIEEFTASNGWLNRFKKRHVPFMKHLETNEEAVQEWFSKVSQLYNNYSPENIYNFDECSFYQRNIFPRTAGRSIDKTSGKERLTVCFLCSLVHKENPLVIGRNKNPICFKNIDIENTYNITWRSDVYGGLSCEIFEEYLIKFDESLKNQNRNVILFLNNTITCHLDLQFKLSNIKLEFVPATISDRVQPLYLGIIKAFKRNYKKEAIKSLSNDTDIPIEEEIVKKISLLDACCWVSKSWYSLSTLLIQSSFKKAGLLENSTVFYESLLDDGFSSSSEEAGELKNKQKKIFEINLKVFIFTF